MHAFSGRFSRTCLEGISFKFFVYFIFNVTLGSAPKRKNFDIQRNTRVGSGGQFTSIRLSNDHMSIPFGLFFLRNEFSSVASNCPTLLLDLQLKCALLLDQQLKCALLLDHQLKCAL